MTIEELKVLITANADELKKEIQSATAEIKKFSGQTKKELNTSLSSLQGKMSKIGNAIKKAVVKIGKVALSAVKTAISSIEKVISKLFTSLTALRKKIRVGLAAIGVGIIGLGKKAIDVASDLAEVQNVIDVAFGESSKLVDAFADSALKKYGMSELTVKTMAGQFKEMAKEMGVADDASTNMALNLTGLAGDLASFWNTSIEQAGTALEGIYTDNWRALKKYGILLDESTLSEYALSKGITKKLSAMTQAEKAMLRYNYAMSVTSDIQGDFARTSGTWANQSKLLTEQWKQFLGVMGGAIKSVFTPVLQALNSILAAAITVAKTLLGIAGINFEVMPASVSSAAGSAGELEEGLEGANGSAKSLAKTLSGFDELNLLQSKNGGGGSGAGGGGGSSLEIEDAQVSIEKGESAINGSFADWLANANNWIKNTLMPTLSEWGSKIAGWINSFVDNTPWQLIGNTIANLQNAITNGLYNFWNDLDGVKLGTGLGELINGWIEDVDVKLLAKKVQAKFDTIMSAGTAFLKTTNWVDLGKLIGEWIAETDWTDVGKKISELLSNAIISALKLAKGIVEGSDSTDIWGDLKKGWSEGWDTPGIQTAWSDFITALDNDQGTFGQIKQNIDKLIDSLDNLTAKVESLVKILGPMTIALTSINLLATVLGKSWGALSGVFGAGAFSLSKLGTALSSIGVMAKDAGSAIVAFATGPIGLIIGAIALVITSLITAYKKNEEFRASVNAWYDETIKPIVDKVVDIWENHLKPVFSAIWDIIKSIWDLIVAALTAIGTAVGNILMPIIDSVWNKVKWLWDFLTTFISGLLDGLTAFLKNVKGMVDGLIKIFNGITQFFNGVFAGDLEEAGKGIANIFRGLIQIVGNLFVGIGNLALGAIEGAINGLIDIVNGAISGFKTVVQKLGSLVGKDWGSNINLISARVSFGKIDPIEIPALATGGAVYSPTMAMVGEYTGASHNPEIVAPESVITEIFSQQLTELIPVLTQQFTRVVSAIDNKDMDVRIGDDAIAASAQRGNKNYYRRTGQPLFSF